MTTTPTPRPVPTREDRMRDARTDAFARVGQHAKAITDQIGGSFGTYLDATERDQLDARAATAEQERDEALDELRDTRADRKHKTEVLIATARALDMLPGDRIDDTPAVASRLRAERDEARRDRDDYREARDVLRHQLDHYRAVTRRLGTQAAEAAGWELIADQSTKHVTDLTEQRDTLRRAIDAIREARTHTCDTHCTEGGCDFDLGGFVDRVDQILDGGATPPPGLGSPPPRAQDEPGRRSETGCMGDPDTELRLAGVHPDQEAARRQGYADAIAALRDDDRYMAWWSSTGVKPAATVRQHLAAYLETVGPDGPDVTKPMPEREG